MRDMCASFRWAGASIVLFPLDPVGFHPALTFSTYSQLSITVGCNNHQLCCCRGELLFILFVLLPIKLFVRHCTDLQDQNLTNGCHNNNAFQYHPLGMIAKM